MKLNTTSQILHIYRYIGNLRETIKFKNFKFKGANWAE